MSKWRAAGIQKDVSVKVSFFHSLAAVITEKEILCKNSLLFFFFTSFRP
jgi:hypothetical protein